MFQPERWRFAATKVDYWSRSVMLTSMMTGVFITIEGGGSLVRTAQVHRLTMRLRTQGINVVEMPEIGATDGNAAILNLLQRSPPGQWSPEAEALLMFAAQNDLLEKVVRPALAGGRWIIGAGFADASRARQSARSEAEAAWVQIVEDAVVGPDRPNLTFILEGASTSSADKGGSHALLNGIGTISQRTRRTLLDIARGDPERCRLVDPSDGDDAVAETIWNAVKVVLGERGHIVWPIENS
jgi:dTMP kinase